MSRKNHFRIRLLVGCDGLEVDASHFHKCKFPDANRDVTCRLCKMEPEDSAHFITHCSALSGTRDILIWAHATHFP